LDLLAYTITLLPSDCNAVAEYFQLNPEAKAAVGEAMNVICWLVAHIEQRKPLKEKQQEAYECLVPLTLPNLHSWGSLYHAIHQLLTTKDALQVYAQAYAGTPLFRPDQGEVTMKVVGEQRYVLLVQALQSAARKC